MVAGKKVLSQVGIANSYANVMGGSVPAMLENVPPLGKRVVMMSHVPMDYPLEMREGL